MNNPASNESAILQHEVRVAADRDVYRFIRDIHKVGDKAQACLLVNGRFIEHEVHSTVVAALKTPLGGIDTGEVVIRELLNEDNVSRCYLE